MHLFPNTTIANTMLLLLSISPINSDSPVTAVCPGLPLPHFRDTTHSWHSDSGCKSWLLVNQTRDRIQPGLVTWIGRPGSLVECLPMSVWVYSMLCGSVRAVVSGFMADIGVGTLMFSFISFFPFYLFPSYFCLSLFHSFSFFLSLKKKLIVSFFKICFYFYSSFFLNERSVSVCLFRFVVHLAIVSISSSPRKMRQFSVPKCP